MPRMSASHGPRARVDRSAVAGLGPAAAAAAALARARRRCELERTRHGAASRCKIVGPEGATEPASSGGAGLGEPCM